MKAIVCACSIPAVALATSLAGRGTGGVAAAAWLRPAQPALTGSGTYTSIQADRGKVVYEQSCTACHGASLRGGANEFAAPALAGPFFLEKWSGRTLEELYRYAAENMPPDRRLSPEAYVDLIAYILQVLKYPAGNTELSGDAAVMKRPIQAQQ